MMNSISVTGQHSSQIVNSIRLEDDTEITNCLYTNKSTIRSTMIDIFSHNFNKKDNCTNGFKSNDPVLCNFKNNVDQEFSQWSVIF